MTTLPVTTSIRWLRRSQRFARSMASWMGALHSGVCMGLIADRRFVDFDTYPFDESRPIDVLPESKSGLAAWEQAAVEKHVSPGKPVLLIGAGGGRVLLGLREQNYDVEAIEYGPLLCEATNEILRELECPVSLTAARRWEVPAEGEFDAAFVARHYLSHIRGRANRVAFLRNVRGALSSSATLIVSYYVRARGARAFAAQARLANFLRACRCSRDPRIETGDHIDPESPLLHHHYTADELRDEMREAGFEVLEQDASWFGWAIARPLPH
jgi:hypothetical protein